MFMKQKQHLHTLFCLQNMGVVVRLLDITYKHGLKKKMKIAGYISSPNLGKNSKAGNLKLVFLILCFYIKIQIFILYFICILKEFHSSYKVAFVLLSTKLAKCQCQKLAIFYNELLTNVCHIDLFRNPHMVKETLYLPRNKA